MWKSSLVRSRESSWGGGERNGSAGGVMKDGASTDRGKQRPAATLGITIDNIKSTTTEDVTEERGTIESTKKNDRTSSSCSSSSSSSSSNSSMGGKLLQVLKRTVHVSSGATTASPDDHPSTHQPKEGSRRITRRSDDEVIIPAFRGQSSVDRLEDELLILRRKLEKREAEMQRLANEVSTLRVVTAAGCGVERQSQSQALSVKAQQERSRRMNRIDSFSSDTPQLSCLDFSLASTGNIKFEGEIKTITTPKSSEAAKESGGQTASILSDAAAVGAEQLSKFSGGTILKEVRRTTTGSPSSHVQEMEIVDKHVEDTKKSLDESKAEYLEKYRHNHIGGDLKSPEIVKNPGDGFSDVHADASRSPPSSASSASSSCSEEPDFTCPYLGPWTSSDSRKSFVAEEAVSAKETDGMIPAAGVRKSSCARVVVEVDEKSFVVELGDGEKVDEEKSLKVPMSNQTEDSFKQVTSSKAAWFSKEHKLTIEIPPPTEDPLKVLMSSCVMHELDKFSKTMKSLKREESLTSSKYPDRMISRSTSVLTPPDLVVPADQALPNVGAQVRRHSPNWEMKERNVLEQPRPVKLSWNKNVRDLESIVSTKYGRPTVPMADPNRFDVENLPPSKSQVSNVYGTRSLTSPQTREYTRRTCTADHHESSSPSSSSIPPSAREFSPSRNSPRRQLSFDGPPGWKPDSGSADRVCPNVSDLSGENSEGEVDLEEEVRQCLEQSRLLLMSDASSSTVEHGAPKPVSRSSTVEHAAPKPVSRETSYSVLALSRQRRNMEKSRSSPRGPPRGSPERLDGHEQHATFIDVDRKTLNTQSGKVVVNEPRVLTEPESEDYFTNPHSLSNAVEGYDKKHSQPSCESGVSDSNLRNLSSLPSRRSRFFIEANSTRFSQVA